jgi:hypothetical protein
VRRLLIVAWVIGVTASIGMTLIGCPAAHDGYPTTACSLANDNQMTGGNSDCFVGEVCDPKTLMCSPPPSDMSVLLDMPYPDFVVPEDLLGIDGGDL